MDTESDLLHGLPDQQRARIEAQIVYRDYPAGHLFYEAGERADHLLLLVAGQVRIAKRWPEGRALILLDLEPGAVFGEAALIESQEHDSSAEALSPCWVGALHTDDLHRLLVSDPALALRCIDLLGQRLRALESKLTDIAFKSVPQRLAGVLLDLAERHSEQAASGAPAAVARQTHQHLADLIGTYRETVTKVIGELRASGLIRVDEEMIYLTDLARLRALAGQ